MFSGIIQHLGEVRQIEERSEGRVLWLWSPIFEMQTLQKHPLRIGDSIAINGVCLTVTSWSDGVGQFDLASETLRCTTLGELKVGDVCHVEPSLRLGDSIDGHFVFGHVDAVVNLQSKQNEGDTLRLRFSLPRELLPMVARKGSIALNGVSLTVGEVSEKEFSVYLVPHTQQNTRLAACEVGQGVNVEVDMLARYVARQLGLQAL